MHRDAARRTVETIQHVVQGRLDVVTGVHDGPADANVLRRVVRIHAEPQRRLVEGVACLACPLGALEPSLVRGVELLFDDWDVVSALRAITVREDS